MFFLRLFTNTSFVDILDIENWTPLVYAVNSCNTKIVEMLIAAKADVSIRDTVHGRAALDIAKYRQFHDIVRILGGDPSDTSYHRTEAEIAEHGAQTAVLSKGVRFGQEELFLGRYSIEEEDVNEIECFRQYPDICPTLNIAALDTVLCNACVTLRFFHDRTAHDAAVTEAERSKSGFLRASALGANEFLLVIPKTKT